MTNDLPGFDQETIEFVQHWKPCKDAQPEDLVNFVFGLGGQVRAHFDDWKLGVRSPAWLKLPLALTSPVYDHEETLLESLQERSARVRGFAKLFRLTEAAERLDLELEILLSWLERQWIPGLLLFPEERYLLRRGNPPPSGPSWYVPKEWLDEVGELMARPHPGLGWEELAAIAAQNLVRERFSEGGRWLPGAPNGAE